MHALGMPTNGESISHLTKNRPRIGICTCWLRFNNLPVVTKDKQKREKIESYDLHRAFFRCLFFLTERSFSLSTLSSCKHAYDDGLTSIPKEVPGLDGKTWEPDARRQDPALYSVPCLVILLIFVATVINMEVRK